VDLDELLRRAMEGLERVTGEICESRVGLGVLGFWDLRFWILDFGFGLWVLGGGWFGLRTGGDGWGLSIEFVPSKN
jgi:hypothetical protein